MDKSRKITKLEDLEAWVEARKLGRMVFEASRLLPAEEKYGVGKHMNENGRGAPANIAGGFGRYHYQECIQFYRIARGALEEQRSDVYICSDRGYFDENLTKELVAQIDKVERLLNGLIASAHKAKSKTNMPITSNQ